MNFRVRGVLEKLVHSGFYPIGGIGGFNDYFLTKLKTHPCRDKMLRIARIDRDRRLSFEVVPRRYEYVLTNDC